MGLKAFLPDATMKSQHLRRTMLDPKDLESANLVNVEFEMDSRQRGVLKVFTQQEGWDVMQRLMLNVIHDFNAIAGNAEKDEDVIRTHRNAKVAAQFYTGLMERINYELNIEATVSTVGMSPDNPIVTEDLQ